MHRAQSAMEYLMTYGWAILIIGLVTALLFYNSFIAPGSSSRAQPGACYVYRPNGPGTVQQLALAGLCNNGLPLYVLSASSPTANIPITNLLDAGSEGTVTMWIYPTNPSGSASLYVDGVHENCAPYQISLSGNVLSHSAGTSSALAHPTITLDAWSFVSVSDDPYGGTNVIFTVNNNVTVSGVLTSPRICPPGSGPTIMAEGFQGYIANIQVYSTPMTPNESLALYYEGIGGSPINLQSLLAWYPLNGNMNDYSGNGGTTNAVGGGYIYTSTWASTYTAP